MNDLALALRQVKYENRSFWRNPPAAFFTFALPLMFLVIFNLLFGDDERNEGPHVGAGTAVLQNPEQLAVRSPRLPGLVREVARQQAFQRARRDVRPEDSLAVRTMAGPAEGLAFEQGLALRDRFGRGRQRIRDGAGRLDLVFRHAGTQDLRVRPPGLRQDLKGQGSGRQHHPGRSHRPLPSPNPTIPCGACGRRTSDARHGRSEPWRPSARDGR